DRDTAQWSADSLGRGEVEEVAEGYSYGANTIRDGVSLTPRRELRALALPSEIMRLPNLTGYLKFPGPLPVASIRLNYVARPKAAERFVAREGDGAGPKGENGGAADIGEAPPAPPAGEDGWRIAEPADMAGAGLDGEAVAPEAAPGIGQGELDLVALPGETGGEEAEIAPAAAGEAPQRDAGPERQPPPAAGPAMDGEDAGEPDAGRKREWL
ncbi:MAG: type IV secretion system DNA-binding domain-containing protein, partial [Alphaproteobacteria bacterium]|nr:type IV secretion system DNA-binding domain-containing protein [Alphaproteobacteria bacterium]